MKFATTFYYYMEKSEPCEFTTFYLDASEATECFLDSKLHGVLYMYNDIADNVTILDTK